MKEIVPDVQCTCTVLAGYLSEACVHWINTACLCRHIRARAPLLAIYMSCYACRTERPD